MPVAWQERIIQKKKKLSYCASWFYVCSQAHKITFQTIFNDLIHKKDEMKSLVKFSSMNEKTPCLQN